MTTIAIIEDKVHELTEGQAIHRFILAGNATFTIVSRKSGDRYTYKVSKVEDRFDKDKFVWFVNLLTGPDNENSFNCIGVLRPNGMFNWTFKRSKKHQGSTSASIIGFEFFWDYLDQHLALHERIQFFHAGRCGRCGRTLTVPESIQSGFGPECAGRM